MSFFADKSDRFQKEEKKFSKEHSIKLRATTRHFYPGQDVFSTPIVEVLEAVYEESLVWFF